ncbi:hypothetical protein GA0070617_1535 [Micromonospora yangpuensis]|uniref:Uncharacterized protein n=2 Tax=Micromonospora yangpuensis TaxID=683228 RepID=A0A1C6U9H1_9ACTN|nr:hypothetical protein GA0070617_1535 [Micromonospora yangpuensis]
MVVLRQARSSGSFAPGWPFGSRWWRYRVALRIVLGLPTHTPKVHAPFAPEQVALLRRWQAVPSVAHMRCPRHGDVQRGSSELVPCANGWRCHFRTPDYPDLACSYAVDWVYAGMLEEDSIRALEEMSVEVVEVSFDDGSNEPLNVFSDYDLLLSFQDAADLDWEEVAERSALDERRGLVITQSTVLEDLLGDVILQLERLSDPERRQREIGQWMIGKRLSRVETLLSSGGYLEASSNFPREALYGAVRRRNELAHGSIIRVIGDAYPRTDGPGKTRRVEWQLVDRRTRESRLITMAGLREDLYAAIAAYTDLLLWTRNHLV